MPTIVTVLYPNKPDSKFDMDYYLSHHMPLAQNEFGPYGMKGWRVAKLLGSPGDQPAPYSVQATLEFGSADEVGEALKNAGEKVIGDVSNFTDLQPVLMFGEVEKSGP